LQLCYAVGLNWVETLDFVLSATYSQCGECQGIGLIVLALIVVLFLNPKLRRWLTYSSIGLETFLSFPVYCTSGARYTRLGLPAIKRKRIQDQHATSHPSIDHYQCPACDCNCSTSLYSLPETDYNGCKSWILTWHCIATSYNNIQHHKRDGPDPDLAAKVEAGLHPFPHHHNNHGHQYGGHGHGHHGKPPQPPPKKRKFGISYSPYNTDSTCKSQDEVNADIDRLVSQSTPPPSENGDGGEESDYSFIRIYGIDCNQTATVTTAAKRHNLRVFAGIFDLSDFPHSLDAIIDVAHSHSSNPTKRNEEARNGWDIFHTIAIGNELVQTHQATIPEVISALHQARSILRFAGYQGPVVTVDTYTMLLEHPELCEASDYCAANCHAFFDATQTPDKAGDYAIDVARRISKGTEGKSGGRKRTVIAESGWPHDGVPNGKAVPSGENQRVAVDSLRTVFREQGEDDGDGDAGLVLFTAFDDLWKTDNEGTFGAEKFWGINR